VLLQVLSSRVSVAHHHFVMRPTAQLLNDVQRGASLYERMSVRGVSSGTILLRLIHYTS
jgi:hypothetical protein